MSDVCQDAPSKGDGAKARSDPPAAHRLPPLTTAMVDARTVAIYEEAEPKWQQSRGEANDDLRYRFRSQAREGLGAGHCPKHSGPARQPGSLTCRYAL